MCFLNIIAALLVIVCRGVVMDHCIIVLVIRGVEHLTIASDAFNVKHVWGTRQKHLVLQFRHQNSDLREQRGQRGEKSPHTAPLAADELKKLAPFLDFRILKKQIF